MGRHRARWSVWRAVGARLRRLRRIAYPLVMAAVLFGGGGLVATTFLRWAGVGS